MDSKNIKIKAVFFILFFLWILMAQGKQGADSLGLWRKAGWNWPLCRPQATGLCTTFSGLKYCCKFNFHPLKEDRGLQKQQKPAFPARESSSAHSSLLSLEVPVQCWAEAADTGNVWKFHLPWGRWLCPDHCSPVFGKKTSTTQSLRCAQHEKASDTSSKSGSGWATMKVWTGKALATQETLPQSGKRKDLIFKGLFQQIKS